jgi:ParB/Sulfiredoxin domain
LKVPISEIRPPRGKLRNPRNVQVYAQRLRSGEQAPPVMLWRMKTGLFKFYIEDGDHRYLAARSIGATTIEARVMPGYIEFFQRNGYVCHRIVEHAEPRPAKPPRRPTKKRGSGTRAG